MITKHIPMTRNKT